MGTGAVVVGRAQEQRSSVLVPRRVRQLFFSSPTDYTNSGSKEALFCRGTNPSHFSFSFSAFARYEIRNTYVSVMAKCCTFGKPNLEAGGPSSLPASRFFCCVWLSRKYGLSGQNIDSCTQITGTCFVSFNFVFDVRG